MSLSAKTKTPETPFYQTGGTLPADAPSYLRRRADDDLLGALLRGEFCYLLNSRQLGKSSLCIQTRRALAERGVRTAYVELSAVGGANADPERWYATLLNALGRELDLHREFAQHRRDNSDKTPVSWLFSALEDIALVHYKVPLIIFLDEIDTTRSLSFPTDEFFGALRSLFNRRTENPDLQRITFCLVGSATQSDLVSDSRISPFNICRQIELRDFSYLEAEPLAHGLQTDRRDGRRLLDRVYFWTEGHPFLMQTVCERIASNPVIQNSADVDQLIADMFFTASARRDNVNLADVANRLLTRTVGDKNPEDNTKNLEVLALYSDVWRQRRHIRDDETNSLVSQLKLSGIVRTSDGTLCVRNRIYRRVFDRNWIKEQGFNIDILPTPVNYFLRWQTGALLGIIFITLASGYAILKWRLDKPASISGLTIQDKAQLTQRLKMTLESMTSQSPAWDTMLLEAKEVIRSGADVRVSNSQGMTALHLAGHGDSELATLCIERGADVNTKSDFGLTPLHMAALGASAEVTELLLKAGVDSQIKDLREQRTALEWALWAKKQAKTDRYDSTIKLLSERP